MKKKKVYKDTIFVNKNLWIVIIAYLFVWAIFHKLENKPIQKRPKSLSEKAILVTRYLYVLYCLDQFVSWLNAIFVFLSCWL